MGPCGGSAVKHGSSESGGPMATVVPLDNDIRAFRRRGVSIARKPGISLLIKLKLPGICQPLRRYVRREPQAGDKARFAFKTRPFKTRFAEQRKPRQLNLPFGKLNLPLDPAVIPRRAKSFALF